MGKKILEALKKEREPRAFFFEYFCFSLCFSLFEMRSPIFSKVALTRLKNTDAQRHLRA